MHSNEDGAIFYVATDRPNAAFVHPPDLAAVHPERLREVEAAFASVVNSAPDRGRVLTDDYNPVEFFDAPNREEIRRRLAVAVKEF